MKKQFLYSLCLLTFATQAFSQQADKAAKLNDLIRSANIPGIQLIYSKDNHAETYNLGAIAGGSKVPVSNASIFEAASLSKAVFAYTVLRLVDREVISLDTPLLHYIGDSYGRFDPADPAYGRITARMVLRHTTGFRNWADPGRIPLLFPPDSCFNYSGEAYMFLLAVVERITHKNLNQLAQEEVFTPLHMGHSSYLWKPEFAAVSTFGSDSVAVGDHSHLNAASSLLTNAHDYSLFLDALASGKGLKPKTHRLMLSQSTPGNWFRHPVIAATPHIGWGLGVGIQHNEKGVSFWQWGDNGDFKAFYIIDTASHEELVYFTHSPRGLYIVQDVIDLFLGKQTTWAIQWVRNGYPQDPYQIGYENPYAVEVFRAGLLKHGFEQATLVWEEEKAKNPSFHISEQDMRAFAGILGEDGQNKHAVEVLKLNTALYPRSSEAFKGLAEEYQSIGNRELAIGNFKKCLMLDPGNKNAAEQLKALLDGRK